MKKNEFLVLGSLLLSGWLCGCTTTRKLDPKPLEPEKTNQTSATVVWIATNVVDSSTATTCIRVTADGAVTEKWGERKRRMPLTETSRRCYDTPTFCRITKAIPPLSPTADFIKSKWGFGLTKQFGFFPVTTRWIGWETLFYPSRKLGLFPIESKINAGNEHVFSAVSLGDGDIECPVFPYTLSDEEGLSLVMTCVYPIALVVSLANGVDTFEKVVLSPFTLVLNPVIDTLTFSTDLTLMVGAVGLEAAYVPLAPAADLALMPTAAALDLSVATVVAAGDVALTPLWVVGDSLMWMGDAVYPSGIKAVTNETPPVVYGDLEMKTETPHLPDWSRYQMLFECDGISKRMPVTSSGSASIPLRDLRSGASFGNPIREVTIALCDEAGKPVGKEPVKMWVDFDVLQEGAGAAQRQNP